MEEQIQFPQNPWGFDWIDGQQLMELLHTSIDTLKKYRKNGILPFSKLGGKLYYNIRDIMIMLDNNRRNNK